MKTLRNTLLLMVSCLLLTTTTTYAGELTGKVINKKTDQVLPFANVVLLQNGNIRSGTTSDLDGYFTFKGMPKGKYTLQVSYVGYTLADKKIRIRQKRDKSIKPIALAPGHTLNEVVVWAPNLHSKEYCFFNCCTKCYGNIAKTGQKTMANSDYSRVSDPALAMPVDIQLQVFPNPASNSTQLLFHVPEKGEVRLTLKNLQGQTVQALLHENEIQGRQQFQLDVSTLPVCIYIIQLQSQQVNLTKRLVISR